MSIIRSIQKICKFSFQKNEQQQQQQQMLVMLRNSNFSQLSLNSKQRKETVRFAGQHKYTEPYGVGYGKSPFGPNPYEKQGHGMWNQSSSKYESDFEEGEHAKAHSQENQSGFGHQNEPSEWRQNETAMRYGQWHSNQWKDHDMSQNPTSSQYWENSESSQFQRRDERNQQQYPSFEDAQRENLDEFQGSYQNSPRDSYQNREENYPEDERIAFGTFTRNNRPQEDPRNGFERSTYQGYDQQLLSEQRQQQEQPNRGNFQINPNEGPQEQWQRYDSGMSNQNMFGSGGRSDGGSGNVHSSGEWGTFVDKATNARPKTGNEERQKEAKESGIGESGGRFARDDQEGVFGYWRS